jgi:L-amino acid N-acyltransferase YncA
MTSSWNGDVNAVKIYLNLLAREDAAEVVEIFNYYIENSFAAYPESKLPPEFFDALVLMTAGYPALTARNDDKVLMGFGFLRPYNPISTFIRTAEITYFVRPDFIGKGIGKALHDYLLQFGKKMGLHTVLANVSSLNEEGIRFHLRNGFTECGRFKETAQKKGQVFDMVYFQKIL